MLDEKCRLDKHIQCGLNIIKIYVCMEESGEK